MAGAEAENAKHLQTIEEHKETIQLLKSKKQNEIQQSGGVDPSLRVVELMEEVRRRRFSSPQLRGRACTGAARRGASLASSAKRG